MLRILWLKITPRSLLLHKLDTAHQKEALDLLFTEKGAGFTFLRNGLGSSPNQPFDFMKSIAPQAPASNSSEVCLGIAYLTSLSILNREYRLI